MEKVQQAYHRAYNSHNNNSHSNDSNNQQQLQQQLIPKGLYVWGGVGTGILLESLFSFCFLFLFFICRKNYVNGFIFYNNKYFKKKKSSFS